MKANAAYTAFGISLGVAVGLVGITALVQGQWALALAAAALGAGWGVTSWRGWRWASPLASTGLILLTVNGLWRSLPAEWLVAGVAAAVVAWDLDGFAARLARFERRPEHARLIRNHLGRLLLVAGVGLVLGEVALRLTLSLGLGLVVGLGLLAFFLLVQAARLLSEAE
jgi:hypothetical protein